VEADLVWAIGKRRKMDKGFPGDARILDEIFNGTKRQRVGIKPDGKAPAREGTEIVDASGNVIGTITSGGFGPSVNGPVAMGYVSPQHARDGTAVGLKVRNQVLPAKIVSMPFVPKRFYKP
jgi:aminomethyltransferase